MDSAVSVNSQLEQLEDSDGRCSRRRNWAGFWLLGLCNNFAYVVMLSAAHDILKTQESQNATAPTSAPVTVDFLVRNNSNSSRYDCSPVSTAAVLLADILPTLLIKLSAPFMIHTVPYGVRVIFCVTMAAASFLLTSFSSAVWMSITGVVFASISSGLGELSFLSLTVFFNRDVLAGWGSGTGAAGVAGALLYSGLVQVGLSPRVTLLLMVTVPLLMLVSYSFLLDPPLVVPQWTTTPPHYQPLSSEERQALTEEDEEDQLTGAGGGRAEPLSFKEKLSVIRALLLRFVLPLGLVYFAEYFINQGLLELLYFQDFFLSHAEQYRWYQTAYQVGVLVSRSSLCCVKIRKLWLLGFLQVVNAVFLLLAVRFWFLPSAWLVLVLVVYEGLLGGAAYVNTFYYISTETENKHREFAMAAASVGDSLGIALAGLVAVPVHSFFCSL